MCVNIKINISGSEEQKIRYSTADKKKKEKEAQTIKKNCILFHATALVRLALALTTVETTQTEKILIN